MDKERKKELKEQYINRHPDIGIVCWRCGDSMWAQISTDAAADFNSTSFQLKLGSWPNRELQQTYKKNPEAFSWELIKKLDYKDYADDHREDLELLLMEFLEEYPDAKPMRPGGLKI